MRLIETDYENNIIKVIEGWVNNQAITDNWLTPIIYQLIQDNANRIVRPLFVEPGQLKERVKVWTLTNRNQIIKMYREFIETNNDWGDLTTSQTTFQNISGTVGLGNIHGVNQKDENKAYNQANSLNIGQYLFSRQNWTNLPIFKELINEITEYWIPW